MLRRRATIALGLIAAGGAVARGADRLDVKDHWLITPASIGTVNSGTYSGVTGLVQSGRNGGDWSGNGIVTSSATETTTLGVATGAQAKGIAETDTAMWNGETISGADTLVMYTYGGDANLDGKVTISDYGKIDFGIGIPDASGWYNGDFNYDGKISISDYGVIDFVVGIQGPPLGGVANLAALSAVPEPSGIAGACVLGLIAGVFRRRRLQAKA